MNERKLEYYEKLFAILDNTKDIDDFHDKIEDLNKEYKDLGESTLKTAFYFEDINNNFWYSSSDMQC